MELYQRQVNKLQIYCEENYLVFPPKETKFIAQFLCFLCDTSDKPKSLINTSIAALQCYYEALDIPNVISDPDIKRLCTSLVKTGTFKPMKRSQVMPVEPFKDLFLSWPENYTLDLSKLRLKVITLLSIVLMLRPSDLAPRAQVYECKPHQNR